MRTLSSAVAAALLMLGAATAHGAKPGLSGDYLEARSCDVYTGACHANGQSVEGGREAIVAWRFDAGSRYERVPLGGLAAVAVVVGDGNLAAPASGRRSVLYLDARARPAQRDGLRAAVERKYAGTLGRVVAVKPADIVYTNRGLDYTVRVPGAVELRTTRYACNHCIMPHSVWYAPLGPAREPIVARAAVNRFLGAAELQERWLRTDENSSFVGRFAF